MALNIVQNEGKKYLDSEGLVALVGKIKEADAAVKSSLGNDIEGAKTELGGRIDSTNNTLTNSINGVKTDVSDLRTDVANIWNVLGLSGDGAGTTTVQGEITKALQELVGTDKFKVEYSDKKIKITLNGAEREIDATPFLKDSFIKDGRVEGTNLVLTLYTTSRTNEGYVIESGTETVTIELSSIVSSLNDTVTRLDSTLGGEDSGLVKKVSELKAAYEESDRAINKKVDDLDIAYKKADHNIEDTIKELDRDYKAADVELKNAYVAADNALRSELQQYADDQASTAYSGISGIPVSSVLAQFS